MDLMSTNFPAAMTHQQATVFELLRSLSREGKLFHKWYQGIIEVIDSNSPDRIAQAAHSLRELCDVLPMAIAEIPTFVNPISAVKPLGPRFLKVKAQFYTSGWTDNVINQPLDEVLQQFEKIFSEPPRSKRFSRALSATDPQVNYLSKDWKRERDKVFETLYKFFQNAAHHNSFPTEPELKEKLQLFETLLLNYLTPCTAAQQKELLRLMGSPVNDGTFSKVSELILHKTANLHFFFDKLEDPDWIPFLDQKGFFDNLPGPEPTDDGRIMYRHHLPLIVLTRLAAKAPRTVANVLIHLRIPENPWVGDQILQCLAKISDPASITKLHPLIAQFAEYPPRTSWLWIQELLKSWIELKVFPEIFHVLGAYFSSALTKQADLNRDAQGSWLLKEIDQKFLDNLTTQFPIPMVGVVFQALSAWAVQEFRELKTGGAEHVQRSYFIEDFKSPPPEHRGIEATLARRLFMAAQQIYMAGNLDAIADLDKLLRANPWHLFKRLRWQLYADFPNFTLQNARPEVLRRIPSLNRIDYSCGSHDYEFAQMLASHVKHHGDAFLSASEVEQFAASVLKGPVDQEGKALEGDNDFFYRKQLWPIAPLLRGEQLAVYRVLVPDDNQLNLENFKPIKSGGFSGGFVASTAPPEADALESMTDEQLWSFLNDWQPGLRFQTLGGWVQQDISALGSKFAIMVEKRPERFSPTSEWWINITRPEILAKILDRAGDRFAKNHTDKGPTVLATNLDWANWLGIAKWVMRKKWSCEAVVGFLCKALESEHTIPDFFASELPHLLRRLVEEVDPGLSGNGNPFNEWLTTAINSIRGEAMEALLNLGLRQKAATSAIEPWIFKLLRSRLESAEESPAIFALLGAKLRICIHLFQKEFKELPNLLFPQDRPEHRSAAIIAHFNYDSPWNKIIHTLPDFMDIALDTLQSMQLEPKEENGKQSRRDFVSQLGIHIACYYWSGSFSTDSEGEAALDRFFNVASKNARSLVISQIAQIWHKPSNPQENRSNIPKVLRVWERRFAQIEHDPGNGPADQYQGELAASLDWLNCECFPFEWRANYSKLALQRLKKVPSGYRLFEAIVEFSTRQERLEPMLELLKAALSKPSEELRWSIQPKKLESVISCGLLSNDLTKQKLAEECKDLLLRMGFSEFLNI